MRKKVWSGEIQTGDLAAKASTEQAPSAALWGFENLERSQKWVPLDAPHWLLFLYITQNPGSTKVQEESFSLSIG